MEQDRTPAFILPPLIYGLYFALAFAIGREGSCQGGVDLYFWLGLLSLPVLFAAPLVFKVVEKICFRILISLASVVVGVLLWACAFEAGGMSFCFRF